MVVAEGGFWSALGFQSRATTDPSPVSTGVAKPSKFESFWQADFRGRGGALFQLWEVPLESEP